MEELIECKIQAATIAKVDKIKHVLQKNLPDASLCETVINIGVFFDGTNNNRQADFPMLAHTNIARLYDAYCREEKKGFYRIYIPGVGTSFPAIGEEGKSTKGSAFAVGCEGRVLFALASVFDSINKHVAYGRDFFSKPQIKALCGRSEPSDDDDRDALGALQMTRGLQEPSEEVRGVRKKFFLSQASLLSNKLKEKGRPIIKECLFDVFGFSRGAAEARVFSNWFNELLVGGKFSGVPIRFRFLGLFDTVASAGMSAGVAGAIVNATLGHFGWAAMKNLKIPAIVENCVHFLAMHELRKNFPLDEIGENGVLPPHHLQFAYPGAHSDVGGGYAPGALGISLGATPEQGDALKLSQIPLNHMLIYAISAGTPLNTKLVRTGLADYDSFAISPQVKRAYNAFLSSSGNKTRTLREWMQPFLNWRWQISQRYATSLHMQRANSEDKYHLSASNRQLIKNAEVLSACGNIAQADRHIASVLSGNQKNIADRRFAQDSVELAALDEEAPRVLADAKAAVPVPSEVAFFFDNFVHDSLAGFRKDLIEPTGYWRYRKAFKGSDKVVFASNESKNDDVA